jgi:hypothetical protein
MTDTFLHPVWTPELVSALRPLTLADQDRQAIREVWSKLPDDTKATLGEIVTRCRLPLITQAAFAVPLLSTEACRHILDRSAGWTFSPNPEEEAAYQIPEAILCAADPELETTVRGWLADTLAPVCLAINGRLPDHYASIQVASYTPETRAESGIHIDYDADYTVVIALNDDFEGGGTLLCDGLLGELSLPALPVGSALIFTGRRLAHRGLPVTRGNRLIMTIWANDDGARW